MEQSVEEFYKGKKVFLTGHTGFKGTWMSVMLEQLGAEVCGYSLPVDAGSFYQKVAPKVIKHVEGDIADSARVLQTVESFRPEIVFHFASHSSLDGSMKIPDFILRTNLMGVVNVLEAVRKVDSVKAVVVVTSDKCYKNRETDVPYKEDAPLDAEDPYSTSKVCQELLTKCYRETFFRDSTRRVAIASARASNVIGAGDYNISRLMPYLLESYSEGRIPQIRNPQSVRPCQFVLDVLEGYLILGEKLYLSLSTKEYFDGPYNFGPDEDGFVTVEMVTGMVKKCFLLNEKEKNIMFNERQEKNLIINETKILKLDSNKAYQKLEWKNRLKLLNAVSWIVDFVQREKLGELDKNLCREQIKKYLNLYNKIG